MTYKHTQSGTLMKIVLGLTLCLLLIISAVNGWQTTFLLSMGGATLLILLVLYLFGSLTVEITDEELQHWFGPGFWKKSYLLQDIESAEIVRNCWIYGWGIRLTPHGWLYNVSGLDAVQIQLRSGRKFRIGTDDAEGLTAALQHAA